MTTVKKAPDGENYIFKRCSGGRIEKRWSKKYLGKPEIGLGHLRVPEELWGKRISFKIIVEER